MPTAYVNPSCVSRNQALWDARQSLLNFGQPFLAPKKHHRELLHQAYALRDMHAVDSGTLADMLELADEALMYAHSVQADKHW